MRSHKCKFFAKMAWFCKCLAAIGDRTRARTRDQSKNEDVVIYHESNTIGKGFIRRWNTKLLTKSISRLAICNQEDIVVQRSLHQSFNKSGTAKGAKRKAIKHIAGVTIYNTLLGVKDEK